MNCLFSSVSIIFIGISTKTKNGNGCTTIQSNIVTSHSLCSSYKKIHTRREGDETKNKKEICIKFVMSSWVLLASTPIYILIDGEDGDIEKVN